MKCIKPIRLSTLQRVVEHEGVPRLIVTVIAGFSIDEPKSLVPEVELWPAVTEALAVENAVIDEAMAKVRGEVLVNGSCHPPGGEAAAVSFVRVQCGDVDKRVAVIGDRKWSRGVPTEPKPFTAMPVDWTRAFGGEGFDQNPLGRGMGAIEVDGEQVRAMPNLEDPQKLIVNPSDRPTPVSLGGMDIRWPQRFKKAGTYDQKWLEERAFGFAEDIDPTMFNLGAPDQWLEGFFAGDETFVVENMHPTRSRIEGSLPPLRPRVFTTRRVEGEEELVFEETTLRLETLRLFPGLLMGVMIFRGSLDVAEDDAEDVQEILIAGEDAAEARPPSHYLECIELRRDHEKAGLLALRERDIMPPAALGWSTHQFKGMVQQLATPEHHLLKNLQRRQALEFERAKEKVRASGMDPDAFNWDAAPDVPDVDPNDLDDVIDQIEQVKKRQQEEMEAAEEKNAKLQQMARDTFAEQGIDFDEVVAEAQKDAAGPPNFDAKKQLEMLRANLAIAREANQPLEELEQLAADPEYEAMLLQAEKNLLDNYRQGAHMRPPLEARGREESDIERTEIEVALHNEIKLEDLDYSGVDLSDMKLPGVDVSGGLMEAVNLSNSDLSGANLSGTVLAHGTLHNTKLAGAKLEDANLGRAEIVGADLSGCDMSRAVLQGTTLRDVSLAGSNLSGVNLIQADLQGGVLFDDTSGDQVVFYKLALAGLSFRKATYSRSVFMECDLRGADFSGADLSRCMFITCPMDGVQFEEATLDGAMIVQECTLSAANFSRAKARQALLRSLDLRAAKFEGADLDGSDLSSSKLEQASFLGARARQALFIRSDLRRAQMQKMDLLGALLMKAKLQATDLSGANLFQADLSLIRADGETKLDGADLGRARVHPKAKQQQT